MCMYFLQAYEAQNVIVLQGLIYYMLWSQYTLQYVHNDLVESAVAMFGRFNIPFGTLIICVMCTVQFVYTWQAGYEMEGEVGNHLYQSATSADDLLLTPAPLQSPMSKF